MKKLLLLTLTIGIFISCENVNSKKIEPNMEFGGWSGISDDSSKESDLTRELMDYYISNKFEDAAYMMADDGAFYFNSTKVSKEEWVGAAALHHSLFDDISNNKIQPAIVTTATYDNGAVWSQAWFWWTGTGKISGNEIQIPVHHAFRFEDKKIVEVYHFFDPTLLDAEVAASQK